MSYRGITLISVVYKIYYDVIRERVTDWLEENNIIHEEQNGSGSIVVVSIICILFHPLLKTEICIKKTHLHVLLMPRGHSIV